MPARPAPCWPSRYSLLEVCVAVSWRAPSPSRLKTTTLLGSPHLRSAVWDPLSKPASHLERACTRHRLSSSFLHLCVVVADESYLIHGRREEINAAVHERRLVERPSPFPGFSVVIRAPEQTWNLLLRPADKRATPAILPPSCQPALLFSIGRPCVFG